MASQNPPVLVPLLLPAGVFAAAPLHSRDALKQLDELCLRSFGSDFTTTVLTMLKDAKDTSK